MANITNTEAIKFCNEEVRPLADSWAQLYFKATAVAAAWNARNIGSLIPNTADLIADGAVTGPDGRPPMTGAMVNGFAAQVVTFLNGLDANSKAGLNALLRISVNPTR